ncbi:unnamed protein product [Adineta steineri]|uniref:G-protein coupled receptors family 1 profile domain-containing protein n=1 Tax=Adineta steineri TaxID=433720 RepID=A0A815L3T2_9BILA|nr:unnamed protein product [Adineta steineri]CAF1614669.1 unnamed protein product [Adineta steineri]
MVLFGTLMILNVRNIRNRVVPQFINVRNERLRANNRQMIIMLSFQVLTTTVFSTPFAVTNLYATIVITILKYKLSASGNAIYNIISNLSRLLYYTNPIIGFYIYTLTGPKFRKEMKRCVRYGLKFALIITGLKQCLSLRIQQELFDENQLGTIDDSLELRRRGNTIHPIQRQRTMT